MCTDNNKSKAAGYVTMEFLGKVLLLTDKKYRELQNSSQLRSIFLIWMRKAALFLNNNILVSTYLSAAT